MKTLKTSHRRIHPQTIISQSWAIIAAVGLVTLLDVRGLDSYFFQITAVFVLLYLAKAKLPSSLANHIESFTITSVVLMIIVSTGGLTSPVFFIVILGLFAISFRTNPWSSLIYSSAIVYFFMARTLVWLPESDPSTLVSLLSLPLLTPFAFLFGREYQLIKLQNERLRALLFEEKRLRQKNIEVRENTLMIASTSLQQSVQAMKEIVQNIDFSIQNRLADVKPWNSLKKQLQSLEAARQQLKTYLED